MTIFKATRTGAWTGKLAVFRAPGAIGFSVIIGCLAAMAPPAPAALIPEPATTFYGKIFDATSGQPYQLTEGGLTWVIRRADGVNQVLHTKLFPLNDGEFSYQLDVPHEVLALGLVSDPGAVPMRAIDDEHAHLLMAVNGVRARILGPAGSAFDASQARRTAAYRLDLAVNLNGRDTDGNGLPDWWELKYGLVNASADPDGDGVNNLAEFLNGTDPNHDDRLPSLATKDLRAYADGTTVVRLRAIDVDSAPSNLVYTVLAAPEIGTLRLRNATAGSADPDQVLAPGSDLTQADFANGRLVYTHPVGGEIEGSSFTVSLRDEDPAHPACTNTVRVLFYRPIREVAASAIVPGLAGLPTGLPQVTGFAAAEQSFVGSYLLSRELGYVISDSSAEAQPLDLAVPSSPLTPLQYAGEYLPSYGPEKRHVLLGGQAADRLAGGMEDDILIGGGGDDSLRGNGGADAFVFADPGNGNDTIEDFSIAENDVIDISRLLGGSSSLLSDYVRLTSTSSNTALGISFTGTGGAYNDMVITLAGVQFTGSDLYTLTDNGNLVTGGKVLPSRISIVATQPAASENGPTPGEFTVTRSGSIAAAFSVDLLITGSAANGVDYQYVPSQITFSPDQRAVTIPVMPYMDAITELSEYVEVVVQAGSGYAVGSPATAEVVIADLLPQLTIEAIEPRAVKAGQAPGDFLVRRSGPTDRSVTVRLQIGGTAVNGTDYNRISGFLTLSPYQTDGNIQIVPSLTADLANAKSVQLTLLPDSPYLLGSPRAAKVMLVQAMTSFAEWRAQYFPASTNTLAQFAAEDPGGFGVPNLQRYAYGLDAHAPDRSGLPRPVLREGFLTVDLWRRPDATDIGYALDVTGDLRNWNSTAASMEELLPGFSADPNVSTFRVVPAATNEPQLFFKVQLNYQP